MNDAYAKGGKDYDFQRKPDQKHDYLPQLNYSSPKQPARPVEPVGPTFLQYEAGDPWIGDGNVEYVPDRWSKSGWKYKPAEDPFQYDRYGWLRKRDQMLGTVRMAAGTRNLLQGGRGYDTIQDSASAAREDLLRSELLKR